MSSDLLFLLYIAKNLVLSGINSLTIHDKSAVDLSDLSAQYYLHESDIGQPTDLSSLESLCNLNRNVDVQVFPNDVLAPSDISSFNVLQHCFHALLLIFLRLSS